MGLASKVETQGCADTFCPVVRSHEPRGTLIVKGGAGRIRGGPDRLVRIREYTIKIIHCHVYIDG